MLRIYFTKSNKAEVEKTAKELNFTLERTRDISDDSEFLIADVITQRLSPKEKEIQEHLEYIPNVSVQLM